MINFRRHWKQQRWPVVGELLPFFEEVERVNNSALPRSETKKWGGFEWSKHIMSGDWGKKAVSRGIANDLDVWASRHPGVYPSGELLDGFERDKANTDAMMRESRNQIPQLQGFYRAFREREGFLAKIYG